MSLLLDTHAFLWFVWDDPRLSARARTAIEDPAARNSVSVASCWEIAIKAGIGKLRLDAPAATFLPRELSANAFQLLPIELLHAAEVETLPPHHGDPFDRMLIAQAKLAGLTIVSADSWFDAYGVARIW